MFWEEFFLSFFFWRGRGVKVCITNTSHIYFFVWSEYLFLVWYLKVCQPDFIYVLVKNQAYQNKWVPHICDKPVPKEERAREIFENKLLSAEAFTSSMYENRKLCVFAYLQQGVKRLSFCSFLKQAWRLANPLVHIKNWFDPSFWFF